MDYVINTEEDRIPVAICYIKERLKDIDREIFDCDYTEDVDGNAVANPPTSNN